MKLLLAGKALSAICSALSSFIVYLANNHVYKLITFRLMESTVGTNWNNLSYTLPIIVISILIFINQSRILNLMLLGDEVTVTLCKNLHVYRQLYLLLSSLIVNFAVYTAGMINFVGIIVHLLFKVQKYYCFDRKDKKSDVRNYKFDGKNFKLLILYILILMLNSYFYKKNNTHYLYIKNIR